MDSRAKTPDLSRTRNQPLKIYHVHAGALGALRDWRVALEPCAKMGFNHIAVCGLFAARTGSEPFLFGDSGPLFAAREPPAASPLEALGELCKIVSAQAFGLIVDVRIDRAQGHGRLWEGYRKVLALPEEGIPPVDPRNPDLASPGVPLLWNETTQAYLIETWSELLVGLSLAGVAGFRWLAPAKVPIAAIRAIIEAVRARVPNAFFLGWTIGTAAADVVRLSEANWDLVASSFPWWDFHQDWFFRETERLQRCAPVVHPLGDPLAACGARPRLPRQLAEAKRALWSAACLGSGSFMPMGFEFGRSYAQDHDVPLPSHAALGGSASRYDLSEELALVHRWLDASASSLALDSARAVPLTGTDAALCVVSRQQSNRDVLVVAINPSDHGAELGASRVVQSLNEASGRLMRVETDAKESTPQALSPMSKIHLDAFGVCMFRPLPGSPIVVTTGGARLSKQLLEAGLAAPRIAIEAVEPQCELGRFAVRRCVGDVVTVEADVWIDGHIEIEVALRWRALDMKTWHEVRMQALGNDRWQASFALERLGRHEFAIEAWVDHFANWVDEVEKKHAAEQVLKLEVAEGVLMVRKALLRTSSQALKRIALRLDALDKEAFTNTWPQAALLLLDKATRAAMAAADERSFLVRTANAFPVEAERRAARFAGWYELFPRSLGKRPGQHGRLSDVVDRLPAIRAMGFDVLYVPPIHPIGTAFRKGKNNAPVAGPEDPGSPYAIGSTEGGHTAVHPQLGTLEDVRTLIAAAAREGIELALDFAIQCSPDHPWLKDHPEWFQFRADGSVRYAENPPKKYQDIVNVDFYSDRVSQSDSAPALHLWQALRDVVLFWVNLGVRIFRVDNPHTKPLPFWEWMIGSVRDQFPDVIFLAEAFTRPKMMARLAKVGFSQSYTYFTWRNEKHELIEYLSELSQTRLAEYFRPHFFVNTPDINPVFLQTSGRPGFLIRAALASLLSGLWGVYSGFELCESEALPGKEEYANSEKYELRWRDWSMPGNIIGEITRLNAIRRANPALQTHVNVTFYNASNEHILYFGKATAERDNVILVAINLDPHHAQEAEIEIPLWEFGLNDWASVLVADLFDENEFVWHGKIQRIRLDPDRRPFSVWRLKNMS